MPDIIELEAFLPAILRGQAITAPVTSIDIRGLNDEPGFHWSNPGLKQVRVRAGAQSFTFVVKRLAAHSKREVLIYRYLSPRKGFPMPRLYHSVYDEEKQDYWIAIERCVSPQPGPHPQELWAAAGQVFAGIHTSFWNATASLPDFFNNNQGQSGAAWGVKSMADFFSGLPPAQVRLLETDFNMALGGLLPALQAVGAELPSRPAPAVKCLLHGALHPPEIMWHAAVDGIPPAPVGIDWEKCCTGAPEEDFQVTGELLARGDTAAVETMLAVYCDAMERAGIRLDRQDFSARACRAGLHHMMARVIPWVLSQYLRTHADAGFTGWRNWARQESPKMLAYVQHALDQGM